MPLLPRPPSLVRVAHLVQDTSGSSSTADAVLTRRGSIPSVVWTCKDTSCRNGDQVSTTCLSHSERIKPEEWKQSKERRTTGGPWGPVSRRPQGNVHFSLDIGLSDGLLTWTSTSVRQSWITQLPSVRSSSSSCYPCLFPHGPLEPLLASHCHLLPFQAPPPPRLPSPRTSSLPLPPSLPPVLPFPVLFTHSLPFAWIYRGFFRKTIDSFEGKNLFIPTPGT